MRLETKHRVKRCPRIRRHHHHHFSCPASSSTSSSSTFHFPLDAFFFFLLSKSKRILRASLSLASCSRNKLDSFALRNCRNPASRMSSAARRRFAVFLPRRRITACTAKTAPVSILSPKVDVEKEREREKIYPPPRLDLLP